jgi:hypothetical protein
MKYGWRKKSLIGAGYWKSVTREKQNLAGFESLS